VQRSKLGGIPNCGRSELGAQSDRENQPSCSNEVMFQFPLRMCSICLLRLPMSRECVTCSMCVYVCVLTGI